MKRQPDFQAENFIRERKRNNRLRRAIALLCAVVMLLTMNSLKMNADTLEHIPGCGLEEHKHTLACYPLLCPLAEAEPQYEIRRAFIGDLHPHIHSEDCYDDNGVLACGYVESLYYHVHNRWCYDDDGNLVCGLNEIRPHQHTEACYQDVPTLICGQDEYPAHHHTEECYFTVRELACGLEENPGHIHTDACYYDHNELTCGLEESVGHVHTSECYIPVVETTCGMEEGPGHIHTEECYTRELICGELESEDHQHTDECYADVLTCEIPEGFGAHTHTESCYTVYNILVCGIPEGEGAHRHTIDCVTSYHTLICGIPEGEGAHTHTDNCYIDYDYLVCGQEETEGHTHTEECYEHTQELICGEQDGSEWVATMLGQEGVQVHTHTDDCFTTFTRTLEDGEERTLRFATCGCLEIPTITSQESDWTSYPVMISEGHTHTAACYDLDAEPICGMVEHEHTDACYQTRPVKTEAPAEGELIPAEGGNGDADSADLADLTEGTDSENGENETNDLSDETPAETNAGGDLDEGENETPVNNDENETADQEQTEVENLEQTEVGNDEGDADVNAPAVDEPSDNEDADTADGELTDGESSNNEDADNADGELTDGEPTDGELTDNEPADIADGELTDGEPTDGELTDNEPADIADGEPADGDELTDNEPVDTADGEPTDDGEPSENESADIADGEPADDGEPSDNEPADIADGEPTDGDEETRRGDVASPAEDAPADAESSDEETDDTVDGEPTDGEPTDDEPADSEPSDADTEDGEPADEEPVEFTAGERVIEVNNGSVTLAWGPEAEIPEDVRVEVVEIERGTPEYDILYNNAMAALSEKKDTETTTQVMRFFDITLYDGEEKFEPKAAISVTVKVNEAEATENDEDVDAIHMEDVGAEAEVVEATTDSNTVSFEAESFSIYGVVVDVPATEAEEPPVSVAVDLSSVDLMAAAEVTDTVALSIPELLAGTDENAVKVEGELGVDPEALQEAKVSAPEGVQVDGDKLVLSADALENGVVSLEVTTYATEEYETIATTHKVDIELNDYQGRTDAAEGENITVTALEGNSLPADAVATAQQVEPAEAAAEPADADTDEIREGDVASPAEPAPAEEGSLPEGAGSPQGETEGVNPSDADEANAPADALDVPSDEESDNADDTENNEASASDDIDATAETISDTISGAVAYDITITNANEDVIAETGMVEVALRPENVNIYEGLPANAIVTNVTYTLIHEHEGEIQELPVDVDVDEAGNVTEFRFQVDKFSTSTLRYTVDFYYGDYEFHIPGEGYILLSRLFNVLHIQADAAQAVSVEFTDPSLLAVYHVVEDVALSQVFAEVGSPRASEIEVGSSEDETLYAADWALVSLKPFTSRETLTITMADGTVYVIWVEDAQYYDYWAMVNDGDLGYFTKAGTNYDLFEKKADGTYKKVKDVHTWLGQIVDYKVDIGGSGDSCDAIHRDGSRYVFWLKIKDNEYSTYYKTKNGQPITYITHENRTPLGDAIFVAFFAPNDKGKVIVVDDNTTKGYVTASGEGFRYPKYGPSGSSLNKGAYVYSNDNVTLTATSYSGYHFKGWFREDGTLYSDNPVLNSRDFTADIVLKPEFDATYTYTVVSNKVGNWYDSNKDDTKDTWREYNTGKFCNTDNGEWSEGKLTASDTVVIPNAGVSSFPNSVHTAAVPDPYPPQNGIDQMNFVFAYWLKDDGTTPVTEGSDLVGYLNSEGNVRDKYNGLDRDTTFVAFYKPENDYIVRINEPAEGGKFEHIAIWYWVDNYRTVKDPDTNEVLFKYYFAGDHPLINAVADPGWYFVGWYNDGNEFISGDQLFNVYEYIYNETYTASWISQPHHLTEKTPGKGEEHKKDLNLTPVFKRIDENYHVWFDFTDGLGGGEVANNTFYARTDKNGNVNGAKSQYMKVHKTGYNSNNPGGEYSTTITLPRADEVEQPQSQNTNRYVLQGWYDIYTDTYYQPGDTVTITQDSVFYADWMPNNYNFGYDDDQLAGAIDTNSFITTKVFDYNNLFNVKLPSIHLDLGRSDVTIPENTGSLAEGARKSDVPYSQYNKEYWYMNGDSTDFVFMTTVSGKGRIMNPYGRELKNQNRETTTNGTYFSAIPTQGLMNISGLKDMLFGTSASDLFPGKKYVGNGNYLYSYDDRTGYYYYDSDKNAASYNQSQNRFYVYNYTNKTNKSNGGDNSDFLPFNYGNSEFTEGYGAPNYWFGMSSQINFFLPNATGTKDAQGNYGNQSTKGRDMVYKFAGDDDVWVYVDGQLILDMGGIHGKIYGEINFSTGRWTIAYNGANKINDADGIMSYTGGSILTDTIDLSEGEHTLSLYYLERGASQSNCAIYFNLSPKYSLQLRKVDAENPDQNLAGAKFGIYTDPECTLAADVWGTYSNIHTNEYEITNASTGCVHCSGLVAGRTYYIKELKAPDNYPDVSEEVITLKLDSDGTPHVESSADWAMAEVTSSEAEGSNNKGEFILYLKVKNRKETTVSAQKIWAMLDGSTYSRNENCTVYVKLQRYTLSSTLTNSTLPNYTVRLVSRYFADSDNKPTNREDGHLVTNTISEHTVSWGGSLSFDVNASGNTGIYSVTKQYGDLTKQEYSNYTADRLFLINGGYTTAPQKGSFTLSNIRRDTEIYVTYIGSAQNADSLNAYINNVKPATGSGVSYKKTEDGEFNGGSTTTHGQSLLVPLNKGNNWKFTWTNLESSAQNGDKYYYYVVEDKTQGEPELSENPLLTNIESYVTTYSSDGLNGGTISVRNTLQALKVKLRKRDKDGGANVEGAQFKIFTEAEYNAHAQDSVIETNAEKWMEEDTYDNEGKVFVSNNEGRFYTGYLPVNATYYLVETGAPAGYKRLEGPVKLEITETSLRYQLPGSNVWHTKKINSEGYYNLYIDNEQAGALKITKAVTMNGESLASANAPTPADGTYTFRIYDENGVNVATDTNGVTIPDVTITITNGKMVGEGVTVSNLDAGTYVVKEIMDAETTTNAVAALDIENTRYNADKGGVVVTVEIGASATVKVAAFTNNVDVADLSVTKAWALTQGNESYKDSHPVTVQLYREDGTAQGEPVELGAAHAGAENYSGDGWTYTWHGLVEGSYYVVETTELVGFQSPTYTVEGGEAMEIPADALAVISRDDDGAITVTNTEGTKRLTVEKVWQGGQQNAVLVQLYRTTVAPDGTGSIPVSVNWEGGAPATGEVTLTFTSTSDEEPKALTLSATDGWTGMVTGAKGDYTVTASPETLGESATGIHTFIEGSATTGQPFTLQTSYTGPVYPVTVTLDWNGLTPTGEVSVTLTKGDETHSVALNSGNEWTATVQGLSGDYAVGYTASQGNYTFSGPQTVTAGSGATCALSATCSASIPVSVNWSDDNKKPTSGELAVAFVKNGTTTNVTLTPDGNGNWTGTLTSNGGAYTVQSTTIAAGDGSGSFTVTGSDLTVDSATDSYTLTATYSARKDIAVSINWGTDHIAPDSGTVTVSFAQNGKETRTVTLNAPEWTGTLLDTDGDYSVTVSPAELGHYTITANGSATAGGSCVLNAELHNITISGEANTVPAEASVSVALYDETTNTQCGDAQTLTSGNLSYSFTVPGDRSYTLNVSETSDDIESVTPPTTTGINSTRTVNITVTPTSNESSVTLIIDPNAGVSMVTAIKQFDTSTNQNVGNDIQWEMVNGNSFITGLTPGTTYSFYIEASDVAFTGATTNGYGTFYFVAETGNHVIRIDEITPENAPENSVLLINQNVQNGVTVNNLEAYFSYGWGYKDNGTTIANGKKFLYKNLTAGDSYRFRVTTPYINVTGATYNNGDNYYYVTVPATGVATVTFTTSQYSKLSTTDASYQLASAGSFLDFLFPTANAATQAAHNVEITNATSLAGVPVPNKLVPADVVAYNTVMLTASGAKTTDGATHLNDTPWTYAWEDLPKYDENGEEYYYYAVETMVLNTTADAITTTYEGQDEETDGEKTVTITNDETFNKGALRITKQVKVNDEPTTGTLADGTYTFTITGPNGYEETREIEITNGVASSIDLTNLTRGIYTITEAESTNGTRLTDRSGDGTDNDGERGIQLTVEPNDIAEDNIAVFTNNIDTGDLSLTKTVTGKPGDDTAFSFEIQLTAPTGVTLASSYPAVQTGDNTLSSVTVTDGAITGIRLKHNETITISGLPAGTAYVIAETGSYTGFHKGTVNNESGVILARTKIEADIQNVFTAEDDVPFYANKHFANGDLNGKQFAFRLTQIAEIPASGEAVQANGNVKLTEPEVIHTEQKNGNNQTVAFTEITFNQDDIGKTFYFMIDEAEIPANLDADNISDHIQYDTTKHYFTVVIGEEDGKLTIAKTPSVSGDDETTAKFTNTQLGKLIVTKTFDGAAAADLTKEDKEAILFSVTGPEGFTAITDLPLSDSSFVLENGVYTLTLDNIPLGNYTVIESNTAIGNYRLTSSIAVDGTTSAVGAAELTAADIDREVAFTNTYDKYELEVTKSFTGAELTDEQKANISFTVGGDGLTGALTHTYDEIADMDDGKWVLTTADNNIQPGVAYTVTETNANLNGYTLTTTYKVNGADAEVPTVTLENSQYTGASIELINHYRDARLVVTKTIAGIPENDLAAALSRITFTIEDVTEGEGAKTATFNGVTLSATDLNAATGRYEKTFTSADGIIPGHTYKVTETATATAPDGRTLKTTTYQVAASEAAQTGTAGSVTLDSGDPTSSGEIDFTNVYTTPTSYTPRVVKALVWTGTETPVTSKWPEEGFTFKLHLASAVDGKTPISFTRADESVTIFSNTEGLTKAFSTIPFTVAGTYTFTITETVPDDAVKDNVKWKDADAVVKAAGGLWKLNGITYNASPVTVVVTVTEDETTHELSASATYGGATVDAATITNTYDTTPTDAPVEVTKALVWKDTEAQIPADAKWPANGFEFKLAYVSGVGEDKAPFADMSAAGVTLPDDTAVNAYVTAKVANFGDIHFEKAGVFTFTLTETVPDEAIAIINESEVTWAGADDAKKQACDYKFRKDGITYDGEPKTVTITVVDTNGVLEASVAYPGPNASLTVTNTYDTLPTSYRPKADKVLKLGESDNDAPSSRWPSEGFTFTLEAVDGVAEDGVTISKANVPMPEGVTETIKYSTGTDGEPEKVKNPEFGVIPYNAAGTYNYTITETVPNDAVNKDGVTWANATPEQRAAGGFRKDGITYNNTPVTVQVVVEDVSGVLTVTSVTYDGEESKNNAIGEATATVKNKVELTDFEFNKKWFSSFETLEAMGWPTGVESIEVTIRRRLLYINAKPEPTTGYTNSDNSFIKVYTLTPTSGTGAGLPHLTVTVKDNVYNYKLSDLEKYGRYDDHEGEWEYFVSETSLDTYSTIYKDADGNQINGAEQTRDDGTIENRFVTYTLPSTGGMGTTTIYIAGASLLILAVLGFIWLNRKRDDGAGI